MTCELPSSPAPTADLVFLAWDDSLKPCIVTLSHGIMENNLGVVPGTRRVSLMVIWSIPVQV